MWNDATWDGAGIFSDPRPGKSARGNALNHSRISLQERHAYEGQRGIHSRRSLGATPLWCRNSPCLNPRGRGLINCRQEEGHRCCRLGRMSVKVTNMSPVEAQIRTSLMLIDF